MTMTMTVDDVMRILKECAGEGEDVERGDALEDTTFEDLGYDSLALIETASRIEHDYGVTIPDEQITELQTPGALLALVNDSLAASA
jgi:act minimal PKS acyl carrier protein